MVMEHIAFKPTLRNDGRSRLSTARFELGGQGVRADDISEIGVKSAKAPCIACGNPLAAKHRRPHRTPQSSAHVLPWRFGFLRPSGPDSRSFTQSRIEDPAVLALAAKSGIRSNPHDEYPRNFTGHLQATARGRQPSRHSRPYMRGGVTRR